jgi:hypothetical protein
MKTPVPQGPDSVERQHLLARLGLDDSRFMDAMKGVPGFEEFVEKMAAEGSGKIARADQTALPVLDFVSGSAADSAPGSIRVRRHHWLRALFK